MKVTDIIEGIVSPASDIVLSWSHPSFQDEGPCGGCVFRPDTEASRTPETVALARLCVEGLKTFHCHEHAMLCRGWTAAVNLRGVPPILVERQRFAAARAVLEAVSPVLDEIEGLRSRLRG